MLVGHSLSLAARRGGLSLIQQAIAILRSYGADAHIYLPGIGTVSGLTAGNYLDSAGTTTASVDNPVGLSLDAAGSVGDNLSPNQALFTPADASWTCAAGGLTAVNGINYGVSLGVLTANKFYKVTVTCTAYTSGTVRARVGTVDVGIALSGLGSQVGYGYASNINIYAMGGGTFNGTVQISCSEVTGIHATQATTANKPILRQSGGKYSWQFDGSNDYLSLSAPLFQMSDDHCVIAGCSPAVSSLTAGVVSQTGTNAYVPNLGFLSGSPYAYWRDDALTVENLGGTSVSVGSAVVLTAVKISNAKRLRQNGVQKASGSIVMGTSTIINQGIGQGGSFWNGSIYPVIAIKGTVTDSDLLTLERFVGQMSGVSI